ncbi:hydrolase [Streptomyces sp. CBMA152]|nr:hydrolase [Streptomyces sp. CBMA152]
MGRVLMLPGFMGSKEDFLPLLEPLSAAGIHTVAVDGRGQHESPGPRSEEAYAQGELAADVLAMSVAISEATASKTPLHLLGHSMGGLTARAAVLSTVSSCPWASLTLMSTGPAAIQLEQQKRIKLLVELLPVLGKEQLWHEMQKLEERDRPSDHTADFLRRRWINTVPEQLMVTGRQLMTEPDRVNELAAVALPMMVVCGQEDYAWPVPWQREMAARLGARHAVITGSAHSPNVENPADTARALISFWESATRPTPPNPRQSSAVPGRPRAGSERGPLPVHR